MRREYDFSKGERGKFYRQDAKVNLPHPIRQDPWAGGESRIANFIMEETEGTLRAYREQPNLVTEHANHEHDTAHGGYAHRQIFELVQNGADALTRSDGASILVRLTGKYLYCADDGNPIDEDGVRALMFSHMSSKRDTSEIGRFGLGFKAVLGVTDSPEFYSRPGSFRFDRQYAAKRIAEVAPAERYPVLRLPVPVDAGEASEGDADLREMMTWATNIVRLPLKSDAREDLAEQIGAFPPEFLLFVDHVRHLSLEDSDRSRDFALQSVNGDLRLDSGEGTSRWKCFKTTHELSAEAREDCSLDDSGNVPIWWAVPLDRLNESDHYHYWSFFPTETASYLSGILNAPWKTNEDRQNLLPGPFNDELINAAAGMVAEHLPELATEQDPARHLDALPRRQERGDNERGNHLRERLDEELRHRPVAPDQTGALRGIRDVSYAPRELTEDRTGEAALEKWASFEQRPTNWLHHSALTTNRMAKIDRLRSSEAWRRSSLSEWLEALVEGFDEENVFAASMAAVQTAAAIPEEKRKRKSLGKILLTQSGAWSTPDPESVFLPSSDEDTGTADRMVHAALASDAETAAALKVLGIKHFSAESRLRFLARKTLVDDNMPDDALWAEFWDVSREIDAEQAYKIIKKAVVEGYQRPSHARARSGDWRPLHSVLLPGDIVLSEGDRDREATIDIEFHCTDLELLKRLGATAKPIQDRDLSSEPSFEHFESECRRVFRLLSFPSPTSPQRSKLHFDSTTGSGPLEVLTLLSDEGKARYTKALLLLENTYRQWMMKHDTPNRYTPIPCSKLAGFPNLTIRSLLEHGRIECDGEYVPFDNVEGPNPANQAALQILLSHQMAPQIKGAFRLAGTILEPVSEEEPEPVGEEEAIPLTDSWPGLTRHLSGQSRTYSLIRCEGLEGTNGSSGGQCVKVDANVYLVSTGDEIDDLRLVAQKLGLHLSDDQLETILQYVPPQEVAAQRATIQASETDSEKLLQAVGEDNLRSRLPESLLAVFESKHAPLTGIELAQAAIATYDTAALKEYRHALAHLDPPASWAGSQPTVDFVRSLGFSAEWAGRRSPRRPPFLEVEGPYSLPDLHDYQKHIVAKVRDMLCNGRVNGGGRRGMISLPTGSGKTRVAVQAVVEAMQDGFTGGVLWVADRDELCEQAVEAWRQVWSSVGAQGKSLRVSRMWAGQPRPVPTSDLHVIVATIQTLKSRLSNQPGNYRFLADFNLVVFDEAHRSVAPTYTSVMGEIGLTRWQRGEEPFLIGLTATPYRGHDEEETKRLVRRYGGVRLDAGAFASDEPTEVIRELQEMRVLAHADHETIEGGEFSLSEDELEKMRAMPYPAWLPQSMEDRIAGDANRTRRIVDAYREFVPEKWPTLIFATSVEHAQTVGALLSSEGSRARAVSGGTETSVRRDIVERFRAGQLDVLVNYGVFREGFDAPRTRVIIVARPVYSPNLYFQMIGRGLRGPKNGGNDRCLIVNVRDNILNFNKALAFDHLDGLWE